MDLGWGLVRVEGMLVGGWGGDCVCLFCCFVWYGLGGFIFFECCEGGFCWDLGGCRDFGSGSVVFGFVLGLWWRLVWCLGVGGVCWEFWIVCVVERGRVEGVWFFGGLGDEEVVGKCWVKVSMWVDCGVC